MDICTIVAKNYLAHARVLARSYAEHHPGARTWVLVIDEVDGYVDAAEEPFELLSARELGIETLDRMLCLYSILELSTAVKPWLLEHLLTAKGLDRVAYLDPDIRVHGDLSEIERLLDDNTMVVTPHLTEALPRDDKRPSETEILMSGSFNLGFIGLRGSAGGLELLEWWAERLETDCVVDPEAGLFVDQRWMDFSPGLVDSFAVLRDPGFNVAYWNLATRRLARKGDAWEVDGRPLRFMHFSGYDPDFPDRLSKHQDRVELGGRGSPLREMCDRYGAELVANGYHEVKDWPYTWAELPNGLPIDKALRAAYREGIEQGALDLAPFSDAGAAELLEWLRSPADEGGAQGVNRYLKAYRDWRKDLSADFPDLDGPAGGRLVAWAEVSGRGVIPDELIPGGGAAGAAPPIHAGVNMAGYFRSVLGVGEHARLVLDGLEAAGVPVSTIGLVAASADQSEEFGGSGPGGAPYPINLISVNADVLPAFAASMGEAFFANRYSIGLWAWEVTSFPDRYLGAFDHVDEVWVLSDHVRDAIQPLSPVPVLTVPLPISVPHFEPRSRAELGLPEGFLFLFAFDFDSVAARKNPVGLVDAYRRAFPDGGPSLILKTINGDRHAAALAAVEQAAAGREDIVLIDRVLPRDEKDALMDACDSYVSLHRAEGFGITLAEAMWLGKPTIATGFSGNLDFMDAGNSYLVDWHPVPIGAGHDPYPAEGEWAEPDLDHAARLMREVFEAPETARARGLRGQREIRAARSPEAAGRVLAKRLVRIQSFAGSTAARRGDGARRIADTATLAKRIQKGPGEDGPPSRAARAKRAARRGLLRTIKPYAVHQQRVDNEILVAIRALDRGLQALGASHARLERRLAEAGESAASSQFELSEHPVAGVVAAFNGGGPGIEELAGGGRSGSYEELIAGLDPVIDLRSVDELTGEGSAGAIVAAGVVDRLEADGVRDLLARGLKALRPGGLLIVETVNPHAPDALRDFWLDPDRTRPLYPETALALAREAGFESGFWYHPGGVGNVEADRLHEPVYALVARRAG